MNIRLLPEGKYCDLLEKADGSVIEYAWRSNVIVDQCRELLTAFMMGDSAMGIQRISLGRGDSNWDNQPYQAPPASTSALVDGAPHSIASTGAAMSLDYLDNTGASTTDVNPRLEVSIVIEGSSLPIAPTEEFPLREFALFGQLDGSDYMIDYVRHGVINMGAADTLTRRVRLVF